MRDDQAAMPWGLLVRLATRLLLAGAVGRAVLRRRGAFGYQTPGQPGAATPAPARTRRGDAAARLAAATIETARFVGRGIGAAVFLAGSSVLLAAGVTLTSLGPRWLGIVLLALAAVTGAMSLVELRGLWRLRRALLRRRHAAALLAEELPPTTGTEPPSRPAERRP